MGFGWQEEEAREGEAMEAVATEEADEGGADIEGEADIYP